MRVETLLYFYGRRLRTHPIQELLAGARDRDRRRARVRGARRERLDRRLGQTRSCAPSSGSADLQLQARDTRGFDERVLREVRALPGVRQRCAAAGAARGADRPERPRGRGRARRASIRALAALVGPARAATSSPAASASCDGVMLPSATADALGLPDPVDAGDRADRCRPCGCGCADGRTSCRSRRCSAARRSVRVANARVAMLPLRRLQQLAGMDGRLTRILVETDPGQETQARAGLAALARRHDLTLGADDGGGRLARRRRSARATRRPASSPRSARCSASCSRSTRCC